MSSAPALFVVIVVVGWAWLFASFMKKWPSHAERRAHLDRVREVTDEASELNEINSRRVSRAWDEGTHVVQERGALHTYLARPITLRLNKTGRCYKEAA